MSEQKFIRAFVEQSDAAEYGSYNYAIQSVYPLFFANSGVVPAGFHDTWYKIRYRINIDTDQYFDITKYFPYFEFELKTGYGGAIYFYMEAAPASVPGSQPFVQETIGINPGGTGNDFSAGYLSNERNGFGSWPTTGIQTDGARVTQSLSEPWTFFTPDRRFFNKINDFVIHNYVSASILYSDIYFDEASGSGTLTQLGSFYTTGSYVASTYSDTFEFIVTINNYFTSDTTRNERIEFHSSTSVDIFQVELGTGSLPPGILNKNASLIVSGGNGGYGSDFSEFIDTYDFINKIKPRSFPYNSTSASFVFYEDYYDGWYVPFFYYAGPNIYTNGNWYTQAGDAYYFDYTKFANVVSTYYEPYDATLIGPYVKLMGDSTGSVGRMMGPLGITGSVIPTDPEVRIVLSPLILKYAITKAPSIRRGLFLQKSSGSSQLSLEPVWPTSSWHLPGDVWFSDTTGSWRGLFYADYSSSFNTASASTSSIVPYKVFATTSSLNLVFGGTW